MSVDSFQRLLKTFGDATRLRMLALLEVEELAVQDLVRVLAVPQSTVSRHLGVLREAGILRERREGTFSYSRLDVPSTGPWRTAWEMARDSLRDDPQAATDAEALELLRNERALQSREWFDAVGPEWDRIRQVFRDDLQRARAIGHLVPRGLRVADIGTGTGVLAVDLSNLGVEVIAVDNADAMLKAAAENLRLAEIGGVELRAGDATALPLEDGEVDAALAHMVLHSVSSPREAIAEMARVVKPGGRVVIVDFLQDDESPRRDHEWMRKDLGVLWQGFSRERVTSWLQDAGLQNLRVEPQAPAASSQDLPATFIASADRVLSSVATDAISS